MKKAIFTLSILFSAIILIAQTPIAHYPLDGNGNDVSGNGLNGTVIGSVITVADRFGNANGAMQFNGTTNSRINISDNTLLRPSSITISAWVNILSPNGLSTFVSKPIGTCINDSWHFGTQGSSFSTWLSRSFSCGDFSQITSPFTTNTWKFIVFTMDEVTDIQRLYVDGAEVATGSFTGSIPYDTNPVILGGAIENGNPDFPFNGILDDVKIYNTVISATQIVNEFTNGLPEENFRTVSSGSWDNALIWERFNGTTWVPVSLAPRFTDGIITIRQNHVVTVTDSRIADQITVETGGTLNIQSNIFNLSNGIGTDLDVSGTLTLGAQLAGVGSVVISAGGHFNWQGGTLNAGSGSVTIETGATGTCTGDNWINQGRFFTNNGILSLNNGRLISGDGGTFVNNGTIHIATGGHIITGCTGCPGLTFNNSSTGVINKNGNDHIEWGNSDNITFNNNGIVNINAGTISLRGKGAHSGTFNIPAGSILNFAGYSEAYINRFNAGGSIAGAGNVNFFGGVPIFEPGSNYESTLVTVHNGAYVYWNMADVTINNFTFISGRCLGTANFTLPGQFTWTGGEWRNTGITTFTNTATVTFNGYLNTYTGSRFINNSNINWIAGRLVSADGGTFTNNAIITIAAEGHILTGCTGCPGLTFTNSSNGVINKNGNDYTEWGNSDNITFNNNGIVNIYTGTISLRGKGAHSGTFNIPAGSILNFAGYSGAYINQFNAGGVIAGAGNVNFDGGVPIFEPGSIYSSTLVTVHNSAYVYWNADNISINNYTFNSGRYYGSGNTTFPGTFTWNGGEWIGSGSSTFTNTATMFINNNDKILGESRHLINNGNITWNGGNILSCNGGFFTNNQLVTITNNNGFYTQCTGGTVLTIQNNGTIEKTSNGTSGINTYSPFTNTGFIKGIGIYHLDNVNFAQNGTIAPGNPIGQLAFNGRQPLSTGSTLQIELQSGSGAGTGHDQLTRNGNLTLAGTLNVVETGSVPNGTYRIIELSSGNISGSFATINLPANYTLQVNANSVDVIKAVICNNPLPVISAGGPTTFCEGGNVVLTSDAISGNVWSNGETTQSITVSTTGNYSVTVTDNNLCSSTSLITTVTVNPLPAIPTVTANGPLTFCDGNSVTLTSNLTSGNLWSNGETTQTITITTGGNYTVTNTDGNNCSSTSVPVNITVNELPVTPIITANGPLTICDGSTVVLSSDAASGNIWSNGESTQSIEVNNSGIFSVTVTNTLGCSSVPSNVIEVIKLNRPVAPVITASGSTSLCFGQSVTLTSDKPTGNFWNTGAQTQSINVNYFSSGEYRLFYIDENNCVSQITTINIIDLPQAPFPLISASGPTSFCPGNSVTLTSSIAEGVTWSTGETTQSITVTNSGNYTATITNSSGCSTQNGPIPVTVYPVPETPTIIINGPTSFCSGGSVTLTSNMAFLGNANSWSNGYIGQSTTVNSSGLYTVSYTDNNGCVSPASVPVVITVFPLPAAPVITIYGQTNFCPGSGVILSSSPSTGYLWNNGASTQNIYVSTTGTYSCRNIDNNGCYSTASNEITTRLKSAEIPVIQISTPITTICRYQAITFTAAILSEIPPTYSFIWRVIRNGSPFNPAGNSGINFTTNQFTLENGDIVYCEYISNTDCYNSLVESNQIQITVLNPANAGNILGPGTLITGTNTSFTSNGSPNGTWESSNTAVATIDAITGLCTPISAGTALISYTISTGCIAPRTIRKTITVLNGNDLIIGPQIICQFSSTYYRINTSLYSDINGGTWSCSDPNVVLQYQFSSPSLVLVSTNSQLPFDLYFTLSNGTVLTKHIDVYSPPTLGPIIGPRNLCQQIIFGYFGNYPYPTFTYRREAVLPVTGYNWTVPSQLLEIVSGQGTTQITVRLKQNFSFNSTMYLTATPVAPCPTAVDPQNTILLTYGVLPPTPSPIIASTNNICPLIGTNNTVQYTINKVGEDAGYYEWITPIGTTVTHPFSGANDTVILVKFLAGYEGGDITVNAQNACGTGGTRTLNVPRNLPAMPSSMSGPTNTCAHQLPGGSLVSYTVPQVSGMTYTWTVPSGVSSFTGQGTNSISFRYPNGFISGTISVTANNGCGTSIPRTKSVSTLYPATPGIIDVIQLQSCPRIFSYTVAGIPTNAQSLFWQVPAGSQILQGQGTTSIQVLYSNNSLSGEVSVYSVSNCRSSSARTTKVKLTACSPSFSGKAENTESEKQTAIVLPEDFSVQVFPNPSTSQFNIKVVSADKEQVHVRVMDAQGRQLKSFTVSPFQTIQTGNELKPGVYLIEIKQGTKMKTERMVKF